MGVKSCLWEAGMIRFNFGVRARCKATGLNAADLHPIDFPEQTIFTLSIFSRLLVCVFLLVRGHFVPFRFIFGLLVLPLVSVCCSSHDCWIFTKYSISSLDSFAIWREAEGTVKKLSLQKSLGLAQPS